MSRKTISNGDEPTLDQPSGLSVSEILDRLERAQRAASEERRAQAEVFAAQVAGLSEALGKQIELTRLTLDDRIDREVGGFKERIGSLEAAVNLRVGDLVAEQRSARKETRLLTAVLVVAVVALAGGNLALDAFGVKVGTTGGGAEDAEADGDVESAPEPGAALPAPSAGAAVFGTAPAPEEVVAERNISAAPVPADAPAEAGAAFPDGGLYPLVGEGPLP